MGRRLLNILLAGALVYVFCGVAVRLGYRRALYPAPAVAHQPHAEGAELVRFGDGWAALHAPAVDEAPTVVHFHGNGEQLSDQARLVSELRARGLGVFAVEYPGYGLCAAGSPSEESLYAAADAALVHLRDRLGVPRERIVLEGQSLGSGVAVEMARRGHGSRMVLLSPFTSMVEMVGRFAPLWPTSVLVGDRYDSLSKAPAIDMPVLIIHGERDELIPLAMAQELGAAFPHAEVVIVPAAGHNDLFVRDTGLLDDIASFAARRE
jgi:uncharacterized protein